MVIEEPETTEESTGLIIPLWIGGGEPNPNADGGCHKCLNGLPHGWDANSGNPIHDKKAFNIDRAFGKEDP